MKRKSGFTLIEILVVMVTIAILSAILLQVIGVGITAAKTYKTKSILWRLRFQSAHKVEALQRLQSRPGFVSSSVEMELISRLQQYRGLPDSTQKILAKKLMLAHYFPQDISERWDAKLYPPGTDVEYALLQVPLGNWIPDDDLHLVDGWGSPIVFYRWPTHLFVAHPELLPAPYNKDPDDPLCSLQGLINPGIPFDSLMPVIMPDACKPYIMVFVSAGPDRKLGLSGPLGDVVDENDLADNLWSINVQ